jgi:hypothetical protein
MGKLNTKLTRISSVALATEKSVSSMVKPRVFKLDCACPTWNLLSSKIRENILKFTYLAF